MDTQIKQDFTPCHICRYSVDMSVGDFWGRDCKKARVLHTCPEGESAVTYLYTHQAIALFREKYGKCPYFEKSRFTKISEFFVNLFKR